MESLSLVSKVTLSLAVVFLSALIGILVYCFAFGGSGSGAENCDQIKHLIYQGTYQGRIVFYAKNYENSTFESLSTGYGTLSEPVPDLDADTFRVTFNYLNGVTSVTEFRMGTDLSNGTAIVDANLPSQTAIALTLVTMDNLGASLREASQIAQPRVDPPVVTPTS